MKSILDFLTHLRDNNNRTWFEEHKDWYISSKKIYERLIERLISEISQFDHTVGRPTVAECVFRIYRDVRFSKEKLPYKTHMGAFIAGGGRKSEKAGYYIHIEPDNSLIGGGIYQPHPDNLKKLRNEIYFDSKTFKNIIEDPDFKSRFSGLIGPKVTRNMKEYDPKVVDIELLKYKNYFVEKTFSNEEVVSGNFEKDVIESCYKIYPMNRFLNRAFTGH